MRDILRFFLAPAMFAGLLLAAARLRYELRDDALCVVVLGVCVRRVAYGNIESARRGSAFWNEHWNRLAFDPCITLRLKSGFIRNFVINPPHTDEFLRELQSRL
jgi:hypothetical protein